MEITKENNFISSVIYLSNRSVLEWGGVFSFLDTLTDFIAKRFGKYEFILVNDACENIFPVKEYFDGKMKNGKVTIVNLSRYYGVELAMSAGVDIAIGDYIFEFDKIRDDYTLELLEEVYHKCLQGNDVVSVTDSAGTDCFSRIFYWVYNFSRLHNHGKLKSELFRLVSRRAINRVKSMTLSTPYRKVQYAQCGLPVISVSHRGNSRRWNGKRRGKNGELHVKMDLAIDTLILFTSFITTITIFLSLFFLMFSLAVGIYVCVCYFGINKPVEGWTPMMGFLSAGFCGVFMILTIIIKYLSLIIKMIFVKQDYLVESVEKL